MRLSKALSTAAAFGLVAGSCLFFGWEFAQTAAASTVFTTAYNLIQSGGSPVTRRTTVNFTGGTTCSDSGGITVCNSTSGGTVGSSNVRAHKAASQSIGNGSITALQFDTNDYANGSAIHSTVTNNTRFTAPTTGNYYMLCQVEWANAGGTDNGSVRSIQIRINGGAVPFQTKGGSLNATVTGAEETWQQVSAFMPLTAGDFGECVVLQRSGGNLNAIGGVDATQGLMWTLQ